MHENYAKTYKKAIKKFDKAFNEESIEDAYAIISKDNTYHLEVLKMDIERMGLDIFKRKNNTFIEISSEDGLDSNKIKVTRKAAMFDGSKCRETFLVQKTKKGWQIVTREKIELKKLFPLVGDKILLKYDSYDWSRSLYIPWLETNVMVSMVADERGPTHNQLRTLEKIIKHQDKNIIPQIAEKTFAFVRDVLENWLGEWEELSDEELTEHLGFTFIKPLNSMQALQTIVRPFRLYISEDVNPDKEVIFVLDVNNTCEMEHGLGFLFKNWQIEDFGFAGDV